MTETRIINYQSRGVCQFILVAKKLKIKSPSLYNRISNLEDLKIKLVSMVGNN